MNLFQYFTPKSSTFYLESDATIRQALEKFDHHKFTVVPLLEPGGHYLSTVSEGDILRFIKNEAHFDITVAEKTRLAEIEKYRPYRACTIDVPFDELTRLALEQNFVPVVDDRGSYMGIVKRKEIIKMLLSCQ